MDRMEQKEKARRRFEQKLRTKRRYASLLKEESDYNERSWQYALYGDLIWEWFEHRLQFYETRKTCSCSMCRNPRKSRLVSPRDKLTFQELKFLDIMRDQVNEYEESDECDE